MYHFLNVLENENYIPPKALNYPYVFSDDDFKSKAKKIIDDNLTIYTVIIVEELLEDSLKEDPKYRIRKNLLCVSELLQETRAQIKRPYFKENEIKDLIKKLNLDTTEGNNSSAEENRQFRIQLEDALHKMKEEIEGFKILTALLNDAKFKLDEHGYLDEDENKELIEVDEKTYKLQYEELLLKLLSPRTIPRFSRVYNMPWPFSHWDSRNIFQQWFFVENGDSVFFAQGGSGSSCQREMHGLYSHTFAEAVKSGAKCKTILARYNSKNELIIEKKIDELKIVNREIAIEKMNWNESIRFLQDFLISINVDYEINKVEYVFNR